MLKRIMALFTALALCLLTAACAGNSTAGESAASESSGASAAAEASADSPSAPEASEPVADTPAVTVPDRVALTDEPVATRGEDSISVLDFTFQFLNLDSQYRGYIGMGVMDLETQQPGILASVKEQALARAKELSMLNKEAVAAGTVLTEEESAQLEASVEAVAGDEQAFLNTYWLTPEQLLELARRDQITTKYYSAALEAIVIPEEELRAAYEESAGVHDQVTVRHVLIQPYDPATANPPEEGRAAVTDAEASAKADDVLAQLNAGGDITALAAEYSEDPGSKDTGGLYTFGMGQMVEEFEAWSFDAARKAGDTGIVKTTHGYHVMLFESRTGYEEAVPALEGELKTAKFTEDHAALYEAVEAGDWVVDQEVMQKPFA